MKRTIRISLLLLFIVLSSVGFVSPNYLSNGLGWLIVAILLAIPTMEFGDLDFIFKSKEPIGADKEE